MSKCLKKPSLVLTLIALAFGPATTAVAQDRTELTYRPPLIPLELAIDSSGTPSVKFSPEVATPLGTFGVGHGSSSIEANQDFYIVFRTKKRESVYCVGTHGKLRLHADGKHQIEISRHKRFANTLVVDISSVRGTVKAEFVPDAESNFLAEVPESAVLSSLYLEKTGDVLSGPRKSKKAGRFHIRFKKKDIRSVTLADFNGKSVPLGGALLVLTCVNNKGETAPVAVPIPKSSIMAAKWFCFCHKQSVRKPTSVVKRVYDHDELFMLFDDGSVYTALYFLPASCIGSVDIDTSSYFGGVVNVSCKNNFYLGDKAKLSFWSDKETRDFYEELKARLK